MTEYRQDDRTEGYCPQCGATLSNVTPGGRGFCGEGHRWQWADWRPRYAPSDRDPGDETDSPNLTPGVMTGEENDR